METKEIFSEKLESPSKAHKYHAIYIIPFPICLLQNKIAHPVSETLSKTNQKSKKNPLLTNIHFTELQSLIEAKMQLLDQFNGFDLQNGFIATVKREIGINLNFRGQTKQFNFHALKIVWSQFLSGERVSSDYLACMSPFEHLIFRVFLSRFGYVSRNCPRELDSHHLQKVLRVVLSRNSEKSMLQTALRAVLKKLMHPFCSGTDNKTFHSDMRPVSLTRSERGQFFAYYFQDGFEPDDEALDSLMQDSLLMIQFIKKMSESERVQKDITKFLFSADTESERGFCHSGRYSVSQSLALRRHKYEIADKISKRLTNYELVLNCLSSKSNPELILRWMGLILQDLGLNPQVSVPCNVFELEEALGLFLQYFYQ